MRLLLALLAISGVPSCARSPEPLNEVFSARLDYAAEQSVHILHLAAPPDRALLIRVAPIGTEVRSKAWVPGGAVLTEVHLPYQRAAPAWHVIEADETTTPINLAVEFVHGHPGGKVRVQAWDLPPGGRLAQAYSLYAQATQALDSEAPERWAPRVAQLDRTARQLARLEQEEASLWAEYLAAYFTYFPLYQFDAAVARARAVRGEASAAALPDIELAALMLEGQAMLEPDPADTPHETEGKAERAQNLLAQAAELAVRHNDRYQSAWAANNRGLGYFYQDQVDAALQHYEQALNLAIELQDNYLVNLIGGNVAIARDRAGDPAGALQALLAVLAALGEHGSVSERAHILAEIGRLYRNLYLFPDAAKALNEALQLSSQLGTPEGTGRITLDLAKAYHAMGQPQRAAELLPVAISDLRTIRHRVGLREAYELQAAIHRSLGQHDMVAAARELQEAQLNTPRDRAEWLFQRGQDSESRGGPAAAALLFAEAHAAATNIGDAELSLRSRLGYCANVDAAKEGRLDCTPGALSEALDAWLPTALPGFALEAQVSLARVLRGNGQMAEALVVLESVIEKMLAHRSRLPGVLGAWYWDRRQQVIVDYMDALLSAKPASDTDWKSLVMLDRLRNLEHGRHREETLTRAELDGASQDLRRLLAALNRASDPSRRAELRGELDRHILARAMGGFTYTSGVDQRSAILTALPEGVAYIDYYLSGKQAWAWVASRDGLRRVALGDGEQLRTLAQHVTEDIRVVGNTRLDASLEALGQRLLAPLGELPGVLLLGAAGELAGLPFEALRRGGRYLALDHQVINVLSLSAIPRLASRASPEAWQDILLAGAPDSGSASGTALPGAGAELEDLHMLFSALEVTQVSGPELRRELLLAKAFERADLVHIASHATLDFRYPELSKIRLSDGPDGPQFLVPLDLQGHAISADLVTLSTCEGTGLDTFTFDAHLGFVTAFLNAGARSVVASLWPVSDRHTRTLMRNFYGRVLRGEAISEALAGAKRDALHHPVRAAPGTWAAFQVYYD